MDRKQTSPQLSQTGDGDDEPRARRAPLTRKNLALFDRMGQKRKRASAPAGESELTETTSATKAGFAVQADKNGILHPVYSKPPANLDEIRKRHARSRTSVSPSRSEHGRYAEKAAKAGNEATMLHTGIRMLKEFGNCYNPQLNRAFTGRRRNAGYSSGLSAPQPDFIEGLERGDFSPFPVNDLPGAVLYEDDLFSPALPHLAGEWKGRGEDMEQATLQAAYDGAAMVHARSEALAYMGKSDPPGHAAVTTFTTDGTHLNMYAHYAVPSSRRAGAPEYHQYKYASTNVMDTYQGYKDGRGGLRNAQDHARDQSYALRDELKEHWEQQQRDTSHPVAEQESPLVPVPDGASADEEARPRRRKKAKPCTGEASADEEAPRHRKKAKPWTDEASADEAPPPRAPARQRKKAKPRTGEASADEAPPPRAPARPRRAKAKPLGRRR